LNTEKMVHMANQIAQFFEPYPRGEAVDGVADHLQKFWEPRMIAQIRGHVAAGAAGLNELVTEAVQKLA